MREIGPIFKRLEGEGAAEYLPLARKFLGILKKRLGALQVGSWERTLKDGTRILLQKAGKLDIVTIIAGGKKLICELPRWLFSERKYQASNVSWWNGGGLARNKAILFGNRDYTDKDFILTWGASTYDRGLLSAEIDILTQSTNGLYFLGKKVLSFSDLHLHGAGIIRDPSSGNLFIATVTSGYPNSSPTTSWKLSLYPSDLAKVKSSCLPPKELGSPYILDFSESSHQDHNNTGAKPCQKYQRFVFSPTRDKFGFAYHYPDYSRRDTQNNPAFSMRICEFSVSFENGIPSSVSQISTKDKQHQMGAEEIDTVVPDEYCEQIYKIYGSPTKQYLALDYTLEGKQVISFVQETDERHLRITIGCYSIRTRHDFANLTFGYETDDVVMKEGISPSPITKNIEEISIHNCQNECSGPGTYTTSYDSYTVVDSFYVPHFDPRYDNIHCGIVGHDASTLFLKYYVNGAEIATADVPNTMENPYYPGDVAGETWVRCPPLQAPYCQNLYTLVYGFSWPPSFIPFSGGDAVILVSTLKEKGVVLSLADIGMSGPSSLTGLNTLPEIEKTLLWVGGTVHDARQEYNAFAVEYNSRGPPEPLTLIEEGEKLPFSFLGLGQTLIKR